METIKCKLTDRIHSNCKEYQVKKKERQRKQSFAIDIKHPQQIICDWILQKKKETNFNDFKEK